MTILEYQRESPWAHKRRTRRMAADIMPRGLERPIVIAAAITAIMAWLTLASWATAEEGQALTECTVQWQGPLCEGAAVECGEDSARGLTAEGGQARMTVAVDPGSTLTIRAEPSRDSRSRGALTAGTAVIVLEQRDDWALVDWPVMVESREASATHLNGAACEPAGMGWVCMDYLADSMAGRANQRGEQP